MQSIYIKDKDKRYILREMDQPGDFYRLRDMNLRLFFAPLSQGGPVAFLDKALSQQSQEEGNLRQDFYVGIADYKYNHLVGSIMVYNACPDENGKTDPRTGQGAKKVKIACFVDPFYQSIRFATDATVDLLTVLRPQLNITTVTAAYDPDNLASEKILTRLGFERAGYLAESNYVAAPKYNAQFNPRHDRFKKRPRVMVETQIDRLFDEAKQLTKKEAPQDKTMINKISREYTTLARHNLLYHLGKLEI